MRSKDKEMITTNTLTEIASGEDSKILFDAHYVYRLMSKTKVNNYFELFPKLSSSVKAKFIEFQPSTHHTELIALQADQAMIAHPRIQFISYPHEWCARMLQDAALFHLHLQRELADVQLYLKDAHPWNILFHHSKFVFVDLPSLVTESEFGENNTQKIENFKHIMNQMFKPYFLLPLCGYAFGDRAWVKSQIERTTLNSATHTMNPRHCLSGKKSTLNKVRSALNLWKIVNQYRAILNKAERVGIKQSLESLIQLVREIPVDNTHSDYKNYYQNKGEAVSHTFNEDWNHKQKSVYQALLEANIHSVIDLAGNTGWYSILAAQLGKKVITLDIDEGCIETLYDQIVANQYDILPLWCSLTDLTKARYSHHSGKTVLFDFNDRMKSDAVMALGIVHHLVLGLNLTFEAVMKQFDSLSNNMLIVEFIEMQDDKIQEESTFFDAYARNPKSFDFYTLENFIKVASDLGYRCEIMPSYPQTRHILVLTKHRLE